MTFITQDRIAPAFRITADDTDITAGILARFKWLRVCDESGLQSDLLEIGLADHDAAKPLKIPRTGAELRVWLGDPALTAERPLTVTGFRDGINGDWLIRRVEHHIDGGGYRCDVEAELPNGAPED
ncbi:hypothetical protein [Ralstonia mannitolilytica]|uniref:hypothetical protein n=1 Tax=Ralstonia mannitolilytica TaxID=105219 RepID=UPI000CEEFE9D|nr:hypothetical protein [Ralstonia mannitolilytica]